MNRKEAEAWIAKRLEELGVSKNNMQLRRVPSHVECKIAVGSFQKIIKATSGVSEAQLMAEFMKLEDYLTEHRGVKHLEDAIAEAAE